MPASLLTLVFVLAAPPSPRLSPGARNELGGGEPSDLHRRADGSYEHRDRDAGFAATVHPDGRVTFRPLAPLVFERPTILGYEIGGGKAPNQDERFNGVSNTLVHRGTTSDSKHDPVINWGPYGAPPILVGVGGRFGGLADLLLRSKGAKAKRDFLERTRVLREQLATEHRRGLERDAIAGLGEQLRSIWSDRSRSAAQRRAAIVVQWADCLDLAEGASDDERARAQGCAKARRVIEAFVRRELPRGRPEAFTAAELESFNAGRSDRFEPYRLRDAVEAAKAARAATGEGADAAAAPIEDQAR